MPDNNNEVNTEIKDKNEPQNLKVYSTSAPGIVHQDKFIVDSRRKQLEELLGKLGDEDSLLKQKFASSAELFEQFDQIADKILALKEEEEINDNKPMAKKKVPIVRIGSELDSYKDVSKKLNDRIIEISKLADRNNEKYAEILLKLDDINKFTQPKDQEFEAELDPNSPFEFDAECEDKARKLIKDETARHDRIEEHFDKMLKAFKTINPKPVEVEEFIQEVSAASEELKQNKCDYSNNIEEMITYFKDSFNAEQNVHYRKKDVLTSYPRSVMASANGFREKAANPANIALRRVRKAAEKCLDHVEHNSVNSRAIDTVEIMHRFTSQKLAADGESELRKYEKTDIVTARKWYKEFLNILKKDGLNLDSPLDRMSVCVAETDRTGDLDAKHHQLNDFYKNDIIRVHSFKSNLDYQESCEKNFHSAFIPQNELKEFKGFAQFNFAGDKKLNQVVANPNELKDDDILALYRNYKEGKLFLTSAPSGELHSSTLRPIVENTEGKLVIAKSLDKIRSQYIEQSGSIKIYDEIDKDKFLKCAEKEKLSIETLTAIHNNGLVALKAMTDGPSLNDMVEAEFQGDFLPAEERALAKRNANHAVISKLKWMSSVFPDWINSEESWQKHVQLATPHAKLEKHTPLSEEETELAEANELYSRNNEEILSHLKHLFNYNNPSLMMKDADIKDINGKPLFDKVQTDSIQYMNRLLKTISQDKGICVNGVRLWKAGSEKAKGLTGSKGNTALVDEKSTLLSERMMAYKTGLSQSNELSADQKKLAGKLIDLELKSIEGHEEVILSKEDYLHANAVKLGIEEIFKKEANEQWKYLSDPEKFSELIKDIEKKPVFAELGKLTSSEQMLLNEKIMSKTSSEHLDKECYTDLLKPFDQLLKDKTNLRGSSDIYRSVQKQLKDYIDNAASMSIAERDSSLEKLEKLIDKYKSGKTDKDLNNSYTRKRYDALNTLKNEVSKIRHVEKAVISLADAGLVNKTVNNEVLDEAARKLRMDQATRVLKAKVFDDRSYAEYIALGVNSPITQETLSKNVNLIMKTPEFKLLSKHLQGKELELRQVDELGRTAMTVMSELQRIRKLNKNNVTKEQLNEAFGRAKTFTIPNTNNSEFNNILKDHWNKVVDEQAKRLGVEVAHENKKILNNVELNNGGPQ